MYKRLRGFTGMPGELTWSSTFAECTLPTRVLHVVREDDILTYDYVTICDELGCPGLKGSVLKETEK